MNFEELVAGFTELVITPLYIIIGGIAVLLIAVNIFFVVLAFKKKNRKISEDRFYMKMKKELQQMKQRGIIVPAETVIEKFRSFKPLDSLSRISFERYRHWFIEKYFPAKCILINMELVNGFHRTFLVVEKDGGFKFRGKKYVFDDDSKYYNMDAKMYVFDYHEGIVLPIKRKIPVSAIKKTIESTDEIDIEYAINPSTLQRFMTAKIAEGVMKGTMLDDFLRKLQMFIIVIMVAVVVHLALFLYASGILENIQMPF